jgi:parvulin-like peptidyl-prolyl isomerase
MAKKTKKRASKELTRKQLSRLERERRMERLLVWGVVAVGVLIVGVLTYGFVVERVIKAREAVAVVGGVPITTSEFQSRVRLARLQIQTELQYWQQQQLVLDPTDTEAQPYLEYIQGNIRDLQGQLSAMSALSIGEQALDQLIQEELVRQEAERRGITIPPEELEQQIEQFFGYDRNPATPTPEPTAAFPAASTGVLTSASTPTPLPTPTPMTEQAFRERYDDYLESLKSQGISEKQYRSWVEVSLLLDLLREQMEAEVPIIADQVKLRFLIVDSEERADELAARLDAGEDFQALVDELESDEESIGYGAELDWLPKSMVELRLDAELADLAFELEVGEHSQPVGDEAGTLYTVIQVAGREAREVDDAMRVSMGDAAFQEWLEAQQVLVERREYEDRVPTEP